MDINEPIFPQYSNDISQFVFLQQMETYEIDLIKYRKAIILQFINKYYQTSFTNLLDVTLPRSEYFSSQENRAKNSKFLLNNAILLYYIHKYLSKYKLKKYIVETHEILQFINKCLSKIGYKIIVHDDDLLKIIRKIKK